MLLLYRWRPKVWHDESGKTSEAGQVRTNQENERSVERLADLVSMVLSAEAERRPRRGLR